MPRFRTAAISKRAMIAQQGVAAQKMQYKTFPAPVAGWVSADSLIGARPGSALVLENFFPLQMSVRVRGGQRLWGRFPDSVTSMLVYNVLNGQKLFAATGTAIYDNSVRSDIYLTDENGDDLLDEDDEPLIIGDEPVAAVGGLTSGYWVGVNFATEGGYYLVAVNGSDPFLIYDGEDFYPISDTALHSLGFDAETAEFEVGETLTGTNSGATAVIVKVVKADEADTFGTLWLNDLSGNFDDDETITSASGSATSDGTTGTGSIMFGAITGDADTNELSHVSAYRNRLFFVKKDTMEVYYLPVGSITGALGLINMAGIFTRGGAVLMTATWSMDAGDGLDDKFVVVSTEGEFAVFQGSNPGDANDWQMVGRYDMTKPMGMKAIMRAGGDLLVATLEGLVPISQAINKDPAALSMAAVSANIQPDWLNAAIDRQALPWEILKWSRKNMMLVLTPTTSEDETEHYCFPCNIETGAWAKFTGWDTRCGEIFNDWAYVGTGDGRVMQIDIGGDDDGDIYVARYAGNWDPMGAIGILKDVKQARATFLTATDILPQISVSTDYKINLPSPPNAPVLSDTPSLWDVGRWDQATWDAGSEKSTRVFGWRSIGRSGYAIAPQLQMTQSGSVQPTAELVEMTMTWESGGLVV